MTISVVIPSRKRLANITQCLKALSAQSVKPKEILVIENNAQQNYVPLLKRFSNLPLKLLLEKRLGKSRARNRGLQEARGDIVVFLDDDCEPASHWLAEIITMYRQNPDIDVVLGKSKELSSSVLMKAYTFQYERWFLDLRVHQKTGRVFCGGALNSRNFAIKRSFLKRSHLKFDGQYDRFGFSEDTDFGEQLESLGAKMMYAPQVEVMHQETNSLIKLLAKKFTNGRAMFLLSQKNIFHSFKKKKKGISHKIKRVLAVTKEFSLVQKPLFLLHLYLIVIFYHLGFLFEKMVSRKTQRTTL
ncbi:MAG: glycosyltransferase family 2 protein [Patescibacteria group bacterium]